MSKGAGIVQDIGIAFKIWQYNRRFHDNERFVGIQPSIQSYGQFFSGYESSDMSKKWQNEGIPIRGNNYWTCGPPTDIGSSSRFDPTSKMYQAWLGVYTHTGTDGNQFGLRDGEPDIELLKLLAEADQEIWLKAYGDDNPVARLTSFEKRGKMKVDGNDAWLYYGEIDSHSDVGFHGKGYEGAYGVVRNRRLVSDKPVDEEFFVPNPNLWDSYVSAHHSVNLKGFFTVVPVGNSVACGYLNGAEYEDNNGRHFDTWQSLERDAIDMIRAVKIDV